MPVISDAGLSEHDDMLKAAKAVATNTSSLRFMIIPMNRATYFNRASNYCYALCRADIYKNSVETINAERATRVHIRHAKGVFRH